MAKKIFISHNHEDMAGCARLKKLLEDAGMDVIAESSADTASLKASKPQIEHCDALILSMTQNIEKSELSKLESEYAEQIGKRVIAVYPDDESKIKVPNYVDISADAIVGWADNDILEAVNGSDKSTKEDGSPYGTRTIKHYDCG